VSLAFVSNPSRNVPNLTMQLMPLLLATFLTSSTLATPFLDTLLAGRQTNDEAYLQEVCFPNTTNPIPPCQEIINIQSACPSGNTTDTLGLEAHAECICGGSFFSDWIGCLDCDYGMPSFTVLTPKFSPSPESTANPPENSSRRTLRTRSQRLQHHYNICLQPPLHRDANSRLRSYFLQLERRNE